MENLQKKGNLPSQLAGKYININAVENYRTKLLRHGEFLTYVYLSYCFSRKYIQLMFNLSLTNLVSLHYSTPLRCK